MTIATPRALTALLAGMMVLSGVTAPCLSAASPDSTAARPWYEQIAVHGFASTSYSYNFHRPPDGVNAYRVFDFDDNTFKLDVAELTVEHACAEPRESGFRMDVAVGGSVPRITAASGLFRDATTGDAEDIDLIQGYATYVVPLGTGLRVDAGKFVTHCGAEVIGGYDGWSDNATRSFLFGYVGPFTHTGVRASLAPGSRVSIMAMVVNGWDDATDNNAAKSFGAQVTLTPSSALTIYMNGIAGAEEPGDSKHVRSLFDLVATLKATQRLILGLNADYGQEQGLLEPYRSRPAQWSGAALYARVHATDRFALATRGEAFRDLDGTRTGIPQTLSSLTLTPELQVAPRITLRADLRADRSDRHVFPSDSGARETQMTVLVNAIATF